MIGIALEVIFAVVLAAKDGLQIKQAKIIAVKNDPLNQPVFDMFAHALIRLKGHDFKELPATGEPWRMQMYSSVDSNRYLITLPQGDFGMFFSDSIRRHYLWEDHGYAVNFRIDYGDIAG